MVEREEHHKVAIILNGCVSMESVTVIWIVKAIGGVLESYCSLSLYWVPPECRTWCHVPGLTIRGFDFSPSGPRSLVHQRFGCNKGSIEARFPSPFDTFSYIVVIRQSNQVKVQRTLFRSKTERTSFVHSSATIIGRTVPSLIATNR